MDIQAYISSGILESYVLGLATPEENLEVERLAVQHAAIREEIAAIQTALESYAATAPAPSLKGKVMSKLDELAEQDDRLSSPFVAVQKGDNESEDDFGEFGYDYPEDADADYPNVYDDEESDREITGIGPYVAETERKRWRLNYWTAAACVLLGLSILANLYFYQRWRQTETQLVEANASQQLLAQRTRNLEQRLNVAMHTASVVSNPDYRIVSLRPVSQNMQAEVVLYWHPVNGHLYIAANKLPPLPKGKKYQLWAIVGDKKMDAGVFAPKQDETLLVMKTMPNMRPHAFAVTMEDEQGSPVPTSDVYVLGKLET
ncbi:MAG: anti-sigma factor [Cytophagales bacterium]|nr:anti-sigma factor [Cytophagales bacterium]